MILIDYHFGLYINPYIPPREDYEWNVFIWEIVWDKKFPKRDHNLVRAILND